MTNDNLFFLSAQPDEIYFQWQLEIQLLNFHRVGIPGRNIIILIAYDPVKGLKKEMETFISENAGQAMFYTYPDERSSRKYLSSIRPYLIKKHLQQYPELAANPIFYHDSDILFRELPDFGRMLTDDQWYVSDAASYLNIPYITRVGGTTLLQEMCSAIAIDVDIVEKNDAHAGGAQYLIKGTDAAFWDKVERDCEILFPMLTAWNNKKSNQDYQEKGIRKSESRGIQAWCTDMWVLMWNAWQEGHSFIVDAELDFCWPTDMLAIWEQKKILHYSGVTKEEEEVLFHKGKYISHTPFYDHFHRIDKNRCSIVCVDHITELICRKRAMRKDLTDITFLIPVRIDSTDRQGNLEMVVNYLSNNFKTNIIVLEADSVPQVDLSIISDVKYLFVEDHDMLFHRTKYNNQLLAAADTPYVAIYDTDVVIAVGQIMEAVEMLREDRADIVSPYDGDFICVDNLFRLIFQKIPDPMLLAANKGKFITASKRSYGGAVFIQKAPFIRAGAENEFFSSWGPEDMERIKRMEILGYRKARIDGPLYHLHHKRAVNSGYVSPDIRLRMMSEFVKICSMNKIALTEYVKTWKWVQTINNDQRSVLCT